MTVVNALLYTAFAFTALWLAISLGHGALWAWRYFRDRKRAPMPGDVWMQDNTTELYITRITDDGRVCMQNYPPTMRPFVGMSWSDSPSEWRNRVVSRALWRKR